MVKKKEFFKYLDKDFTEQLRIKISVSKGKVIDVVVQYETLSRETWTPIVRYDCAHGFFHRDIILPGRGKEKQAISIEKLEDALSYAEQDLRDRWEWYKQRYFKLLKK